MHLGNQEEFLEVPHHVIDDNVFVRDIFENKNDGKHSSLSIIFSIWNTMTGSSVVTLPWAYSQSGLLMGISKINY